MSLIVIIIVILLIFGGLGGSYYGYNAGWGPGHFGGIGIGTILIILLVVFLLSGRL